MKINDFGMKNASTVSSHVVANLNTGLQKKILFYLLKP